MKVKSNKKVYKSFEQMKSTLFPCLTEKEEQMSSKWTSSYIGANLADRDIDQLLNKHKCKI